MIAPDHSPHGEDPISGRLYEVDASDPKSELVDRAGLGTRDIAQIDTLMKALSALREEEQRISDASQRYMGLSALDMRALHYLIIAKNRDEVVTPSMIANYLEISAASTTKLLNRLEQGGHIVRHVHPVDRRAFAIEVTPESRAAAMQTVGSQHAQRFHSAARLSGDERDVVIRFLTEMTRDISMDKATWATPED
ncbi:MarR family winged helix-turn-helix transcriptional regulator [Leucobacter denitrificans]|uniref:MarR family transcriptional regulator n=1 Tax=Leucobacter denitrificans TaxID=683042 RepID=A0A7G9S594_9MICO|nr:MarR family transcriptional regulator [Leucobacter denitrificans]QNN63019.1 MarR family transcriptional regulator [Leucobacter denitrificans]